MPVKRRIGKQRRRVWEDEDVIALEGGHRFFDEFEHDDGTLDVDQVRAAWADLGPAIMERWSREKPCLRPWGWWLCELGIEPPVGESRQRRYLHEKGLLTAAERVIVEADKTLLQLKPFGFD